MSHVDSFAFPRCHSFHFKFQKSWQVEKQADPSFDFRTVMTSTEENPRMRKLEALKIQVLFHGHDHTSIRPQMAFPATSTSLMLNLTGTPHSLSSPIPVLLASSTPVFRVQYDVLQYPCFNSAHPISYLTTFVIHLASCVK